MKTTLMRTISIALFIFRDALSGPCTRLTDRTLHCIHYGGPGWATDTLYANVLIIASSSSFLFFFPPIVRRYF